MTCSLLSVFVSTDRPPNEQPQGFESFVMRCPREVTPHLSAIIDMSLRYIKYDPNYSYGDDDEGDEDVDMDEEYEEVCYACTRQRGVFFIL